MKVFEQELSDWKSTDSSIGNYIWHHRSMSKWNLWSVYICEELDKKKTHSVRFFFTTCKLDEWLDEQWKTQHNHQTDISLLKNEIDAFLLRMDKLKAFQ